MPPRSPLAQRLGLDAAWVRTPDRIRTRPARWDTMREWLRERVGEHIDVDRFITEERFVYQSGAPVQAGDAYASHTFVWFHRDIAPETEVPGEVRLLHQDDRLVVVDKPPFLSTIPRGRHVLQSVVVRMRRELGLPELTPLHRLDRVTSGVLLLATERRWRGPYQSMFQRGGVEKIYAAVADLDERLLESMIVRTHISKTPGVMQAETVADAPPNAESEILLERALQDPRTGERRGLYRLRPRTGKTHQLRLHMWGLGVPIDGDPLYPAVANVRIDDFSTPLQLLAKRVEFIDPVDERVRAFESDRSLPLHGPESPAE